MTWKVKFRGKHCLLTYFAPDNEHDTQQALTARDAEPGSFAIDFPLNPEDELAFADIKIKESPDPKQYAYRAIRGHHTVFGEIYMMSSLENGIIIYDGLTGIQPENDTSYTGDGS
jgi:hypothetical protein